MKRTAVIVIVVLLLGLALTIFLMYNHEMPDQVAKSPDYTMSAPQLLDEFRQNKTAATTRYVNKIIQLSGNLKAIDTSGAIVIGMADRPDEIIMAIDSRYKNKLSEVKTGNTVVAQGVCSSYTSDQPSPDDLLAGLGATLRFRAGGIKR